MYFHNILLTFCAYLAIENLLFNEVGLINACIITGVFNTFYLTLNYIMISISYEAANAAILYWNDFYYVGVFFSLVANVVLAVMLLKSKCGFKIAILGFCLNSIWLFLPTVEEVYNLYYNVMRSICFLH